MKLGDRLPLDLPLNTENLSFVKQMGANQVMVRIPTGSFAAESVPNINPTRHPLLSKLAFGNYWETDDLLAVKSQCEASGLELCGLLMTPFKGDKIILGLPGRDAQIDDWCKSLTNMGKAGIPIIQIMWVINARAWLGNWRTTDQTPGRGGARMVSFDYEVAKKVPVADFGEVSDDRMWDNLTYFYKAVIPVAEKAGVKIVMHPADPQVPVITGVARIIRSIKDYDRMFEIAPSESNSMVFCLGCFSQMMDAENVYKAIKYFGSRGKIGYVHLRDIRGTLEKFDEVYPDEGQLDMFKVVKTLKAAGFDGPIHPDHTPHTAGDTEFGHRGHAFALGYIKALLQAAGAVG